MRFPADSIQFIDEIMVVHRERIRRRRPAGEALKYMREAADQQGRGEEFIRLWVHNDRPERPDPADDRTDLALLQIYEHWRDVQGMRPIEQWDGTSLRPWLPPEDNPRVPSILSTRLEKLKAAYTHFNPEYEAYWTRLDALGSAAESYLHQISSHHVWSCPTNAPLARLYYLNELNNFETAPYSVRFWGYLKWVEALRRRLFGLPSTGYDHDSESDISFLDDLNVNHFPWHDDVFDIGICPRVDDQFGRQCRYRYPMGTQGYALEFLRFHADLIKAHDAWLLRNGRPAVEPWIPGVNHTSYLLREAFGGLWGLGGSDGAFLDPNEHAPELLDPNLTAFRTVADLGVYLESCGAKYHGVGHVSNCDIRDVYTNNYSVRFFGWHKWLEGLHQRLRSSGRPDIMPGTRLEDAPPPHSGNTTFCEAFKSPPSEVELASRPFSGCWRLQAFLPKGGSSSPVHWFSADLELEQSDDQLRGRLHVDGHSLDAVGFIDYRHVAYDFEPEPYDRRVIIVIRCTEPQAEEESVHMTAYFPKSWPAHRHEADFLTGTLATTLRIGGQPQRSAIFYAVKAEPS